MTRVIVRALAIASVVMLWGKVAEAQSGPYYFYSLSPCRVVDTRGAAATNGGPVLGAGTTRTFEIKGRCGVPSTAKAVSINITAVSPTADSHLRVWPAGAAMPNASTVNFSAGESAIANGAIVPLASTTNDLSVYNFAGTVHVLIDITGYFQ